MTGFLLAALGLLVGLAMTALGDMASEEIRDRLDQLPRAILRLAARRLTPAQRTTIYDDEWVPELTYILKGAEARPITRLITGTWYALGILTKASRIVRHLHRELEKAPSDSHRPLVDGPSSRRLAWLHAQAEETRLREGTGQLYRRRDLTAPGPRGGHLDFEWHGVRPSEGRHWAYSKENLDRMYADGRIGFSKTGRPFGKSYLDDYPARISHGRATPSAVSN